MLMLLVLHGLHLKPDDKKICLKSSKQFTDNFFDMIINVSNGSDLYDLAPFHGMIKSGQLILRHCFHSNYYIEDFSHCVEHFVAIVPYLKLLKTAYEDNDLNSITMNLAKIGLTVQKGIQRCTYPTLHKTRAISKPLRKPKMLAFPF